MLTFGFEYLVSLFILKKQSEWTCLLDKVINVFEDEWRCIIFLGDDLYCKFVVLMTVLNDD